VPTVICHCASGTRTHTRTIQTNPIHGRKRRRRRMGEEEVDEEKEE
jgi:hypothetical protein